MFPVGIYYCTIRIQGCRTGRAFVASHITMLHPSGKSQASNDSL